MSGAFLSARATAERLIRAKGARVPLSRIVREGFDPVTQDEGLQTLVWVFDAIGLPPSQAHRFKVDLTNRRATEFFIAHSDQELDGVPVVPEPGDTITWNGKDFTLFYAQTYDPDATAPVMTIAYGEV